MKKVLSTFVLIAAMFAISFSSNAQSDNALIAKAKIAATNACNLDLSQYGGCLLGSVETTGICFVSGTTKKVTLVYDVACHCVGDGCPKVAIFIVAEVFLGCDDEVMSVTCY